MVMPKKIAVWKFASCDGCQLTLIDCLEELMALGDRIQIAEFREVSRASVEGPFDLSIVEGSVSVPEDVHRIRRVRENSQYLLTIGACATSGGIQALRNIQAADEFVSAVYAHPDYIDTLATSDPIASHVAVDFELRGCPINRSQLLEVINAYLFDRKPQIATYSVCMECKRRGTPCIMVSRQTPCLGPVTQAGCGAICPAYGRGCYGCFGPMETPNMQALTAQLASLGETEEQIRRSLRTFNTNAPPFHEAAEYVDTDD